MKRIKIRKQRKLQTYWIDEELIEMLDVVTSINKIGKSELVNNLIRNYIIANKTSVNEIMLNYWKNRE